MASLQRIRRHTQTLVARSVKTTVITMQQMQYSSGLVTMGESRRFMIDCFVASATPPVHAQQMADLLVEADYRGHFSHGMNRLEMYINDLHAGCTDGHATPALLQQSPATAWVDGRNGLGAVIGNYCMDLAIDKARKVGVGVVTAKGSNHYGIAGWYSMRAQNQGLIGISMTNTSPLLTPTGSADSALGTNPISFAAPASGGDSFVLDMATTAVALGKVEIQRRKGQALPYGWAQDKEGNITTDAEVAFEASRLMPLGGAEDTSGYKGYGLAAMVETLCGVLAGANFATNIRHWTLEGSADPPNLGQFFMAIDPKCFAPSFEDRMSEQNNILRGMKPINSAKPVMVAGDPERNHQLAVDSKGGIQYLPNQLEACARLASSLNIKPLQFVYSKTITPVIRTQA